MVRHCAADAVPAAGLLTVHWEFRLGGKLDQLSEE